MKLLLVALHDTTASVVGSSTMSYVLVRNGGGPPSWSASIGLGWPLAVTADDRLSTLTEFNIPWFMAAPSMEQTKSITSARSRTMYQILVHSTPLCFGTRNGLSYVNTGSYLVLANCQASGTARRHGSGVTKARSMGTRTRCGEADRLTGVITQPCDERFRSPHHDPRAADT